MTRQGLADVNTVPMRNLGRDNDLGQINDVECDRFVDGLGKAGGGTVTHACGTLQPVPHNPARSTGVSP